MSETQALETEVEIKPVDGEAVGESEVAEPELVEIEIEDGEKPSPKKVSRFETRLRNKNEKISEVERLAEQRQQELEAARAELELLKLRDKQQKPPNEDDFDDPRDYQKAATAYNEARTAEIADKIADEKLKRFQEQTYQATQSQKQGESISEHYKRADSLPISNYDALEGNALSILGEPFIQAIIENTDNSEMLIASIGASPAKAAEIAKLSANPQTAAKAFAKAVSFPVNPNLKGPSLKDTPDPETKIKPGGTTQLTGWELKLDKAREKAAVSGDFSYITEVKKQARAAGVNL